MGGKPGDSALWPTHANIILKILGVRISTKSPNTAHEYFQVVCNCSRRFLENTAGVPPAKGRGQRVEDKRTEEAMSANITGAVRITDTMSRDR